MYSPDWLRDRVRFHLDPAQSTGQVFLSENEGAAITGHFIVRIERDEGGRRFGYGSTIFVEPASRGSGIAQSLLEQGERWMRDQGVAEAEYCTADHHVRILRLFSRNGYRIIEKSTEMVRLAKSLD
jgi:GNAT superfamily N-acetyltransferase